MDKIVLTYGVYDLLHTGHLDSLLEAKALGDRLVVGVFKDHVATKFKRKPIIPEDQRRRLVEALACVDETIFLWNLSPEEAIKSVKPDIVAKGPGAGFETIRWDSSIEAHGAKKVLLDYHDGVSTTAIINLCKSVQQSAQ